MLVDLTLRALKEKSDTFLKIKKVANDSYGEYEYYKFKVPFNHEKIQSHYSKLLEACSYRTTNEFVKEAETSSFYSSLHSSKWLRDVSTLLGISTKIVNCLHVSRRNVFLEEEKSSNDCSCIISSLVQLMMNEKTRTIIGFEDLIRKEWFLNGHQFNKRLLTVSILKNEDANDEANFDLGPNAGIVKDSAIKSISPVFLLFLDCVFQLTIQYPDRFEFTEHYLIHLWDYALSGISYEFSFNGLTDWINFVYNQIKTNNSSIKVNEEFLTSLFVENNRFWNDHLERNRSLFLNMNYYTSPTRNHADYKILNPTDKIHVMKFWTRCYLRWYEMNHPYNMLTNELTCDNLNEIQLEQLMMTVSSSKDEDGGDMAGLSYRRQSSNSTSSSVSSSDRPPSYKPPPPPTLLEKQDSELTKSNTDDSTSDNQSTPLNVILRKTTNNNRILNETVITSKGDLQTNF